MKRYFLVLLVFPMALAGCSINASNKQCMANPPAAQVYKKYADKLLSEGKYEEAQSMATRAKKVKVDWNIELTVIKTRVLLAEHRPDILQKSDYQMLKNDLVILAGEKTGMDTDAKVIQGHLALSVRAFDKATKLYKAALAKAPGNAGAHFGMGWVDRLKNKMDDAAKEFKEGLKKDPDNYGALVALGDLAMAKKTYADAQKYYAHASNIMPESIGAAKGLVRALLLQKKADKALALLDNLVIRAPKDRDVFMWRAELLAGKKKWKEAIPMASMALRLGAGVEASVLLARGYLDIKQYGQAEGVLRGALKQTRGNFQLSYLMAVTLDRMGHKRAALRSYTAILKVLKNANPKVAAQLAGVQKTCKAAITRLSHGLEPPKKASPKRK